MGSYVDKNLCDRFSLVVEKSGLTQVEFAKTIDARQSDISAFRYYRYEPSKTLIVSIIKKFSIDAHWLLTGEGEMYRRAENRVRENGGNYNEKQLLEEVMRLRRENARLKEALVRLATETPSKEE